MADAVYNINRADPIFDALAAVSDARKTFENAVRALSLAEGECYELRHLYARTITISHKGIKKVIRSHDELRSHFQLIHPRYAIGRDKFTDADLIAWEVARDDAHKRLDAVLSSFHAMRKRYNLDQLEAAEASASKAVLQAELDLMSTRPRTMQGVAALLRFIIGYIQEDNGIDPVIDALCTVECVLLELAEA